MNTVAYWLAFQSVGLGWQSLQPLLQHFGSIESLWASSNHDLRVTGASPKLIAKIEAARARDVNQINHQIELPDTAVLTLDHPHYPALLRETASPPLVLFVRGNLSALSHRCLTVVGTRTPSSYGLRAVRLITEPIAADGVTIVSGLAYGIDAAAHQAALASRGATVAVLGSGVDTITPYGNHALGLAILESGGAIISEYPPGTEPQKHHFPQRNRIISGLSRATVIVEAGVKSGALLTARFALDENRELFAVPGPIDQEKSAGPNNLLKLGAAPVTSADDLRAALGLDNHRLVTETVELRADSPAEAAVLRLLAEPRHVDELVAISTLETSVINATLSLLEMKGRVRHLGGMHYIRIP
ncbi:MAG: DNA-protecting protein DprA [Candidatus Kerfeldbacteria bacterium]|nr:DNA-protecting protein DprA [Candidatus Kerfeldbacteria bacterium]